MRTWKATGTALMLLLVSAPAVLAQGGPRRDFDPDRQISAMTERLDLTDDQAAQIRVILVEQNEAMTTMMEQHRGQGNPEAMREAMTAHREATHARIAEVLTAEQAEEWKEMEKAMRERRRGGS